IARALTAMMPMRSIPSDSSDSDENFLLWLRRHRQTERAIERFWKVVLVSALNEELERTSVRYAVQVFRESFLKSAEAGRMGVPMVPLTDLYSAGTEYITQRGGSVRLRASVDSIEMQADGVRVVSGPEPFTSDYVVLAVPYHTLEKILPAGETSEALAK